LVPFALFPREIVALGFDVILASFDASSKVHLRSSPQSIPDEFISPFNRVVHDHPLSKKAAFGGLKPPPIKRLRWVYHHLLYDITIPRVLGTNNLEAFMREVLTRIADLPITRIHELLPWNLKATHTNALTGNGTTPKLPP
jgi:hypothetical protein